MVSKLVVTLMMRPQPRSIMGWAANRAIRNAPTALTVQEAVTRSSGGYAALFDPGAARIEVAYDAKPFVVLHESAHAWFNGRLIADRWTAGGEVSS